MFLGKWVALDNSSDLWATPAPARRCGAAQEDEFVADIGEVGEKKMGIERGMGRGRRIGTVTLMKRSNSFG